MGIMHFTIPVSGVPADVSFAISSETIAAVGTYDSTIEIVDIEAKKPVVVKKFDAMPRVVAFTLDMKDRLISAFDNDTVALFDVNNGSLKKIAEFQNSEEGGSDGANCVVYINEFVFGVGCINGDVQVWDHRVGQHSVFRVSAGNEEVAQMILAPNQKSILCAMGDGSVSTVKIQNGTVKQSEPCGNPFSCLGTFRDDTKVLVGSGSGRIYVFDTGNYDYHSDVLKPHKAAVNAMIPVTERIGIIGYDDGSIRAYDFFPHKPVGTIGEHPSMVEQMDISADGRLLATVGHEEEVRFWDIGFLEDVDAASEAASPHYRLHLQSSNKQNASDFFAGLNDENEPPAS